MLKIKNFSKTYPGGKRPAVAGLSLAVEPGDIFGFIGHNGAGKTTVIRACAGVLAFREGEISIDGHSVRREPVQAKSALAYVPDNPELYDYLTGAQYLNFVLDMFRVPPAERKKRVGRYAGLFGISDDLGTLISSYSHGMKQKLAITAALAHRPRLVIFDEPFVGLDPKAAFILKELMRELCRQGSAFFFSTHVLETAEKLCNKIAIIKGGVLVASGPTERVTGDSSLERVFMELIDDE